MTCKNVYNGNKDLTCPFCAGTKKPPPKKGEKPNKGGFHNYGGGPKKGTN